MTHRKALIAARPWTDTGAISGLFAAASAATGVVGGEQVRILPEQLLRDTSGGERQQSIRIEIGEDETPIALNSAVQHEEGPTHHDLSGSDASAVRESRFDLSGVTVTLDGVAETEFDVTAGPRGSHRLFLRAVAVPTEVEICIPSLDPDQRIRFTIVPVREWSIHLVHHSHLDIGYTDPQAVVLKQQRSFLDSALDLLRTTADDPADTRFRWVVESIFVFDDWAATRPQHLVDEFIGFVRAGRAELTALPYNLHTDTCSTDELHELLRGGQELARRYGVRLHSAMQTDVPGTVGGLPDALAENDVKYLAVAHNWAGRSMPQINGGQLLPRLFRWAAPSGKSVLVWLTDSPHGMAYMEGPLLGFHDNYDHVADTLPVYLSSLASNPYPFPPGVFGWHGTAQAVDREPYPWDILHLRTQGYVGDNAPARLRASAIAREWNDTWASPKIVVSTNTEFFEAAESRLGDQIQTFEGDWGDWWVEGVGSAAYPMALVREAQATVTDAQTVGGIRSLLSGSAMPGAEAQSTAVYETISMFNEHTWGAGNSWRNSDHGFDSGEVQWHWKVANAITAQQQAGEFLERTSSFLGAELAPGEGAVASYYVVNTEAIDRDASVRFFIRESTVPFLAEIAITDARTGDKLAHVEDSQVNHEHRESGRFVTVPIRSLPSLGMVRLDLAVTSATPAGSTPHDEPTGDAGEESVLENAHLRVEVDLGRSVISSIIERATGRELVNADSLFGANEYIYDLYTSAGGFNHQSNKTSTSDELELLGDRRRARPSALISRESDDVEQRLTYEFSAAGASLVQVTLRLGHDEPVLIVENRIAKESTRAKESAFFAFPFAGTDPRMRFEISGGVTGDGLAHVPGAPQHMRAVRNWVTIESEEGAVAWVTRDAPLVERGTIALPYAPFPASTTPNEPGTVISWIHNNIWDTNFPVEQGFDTTFAFAIGVSGSRPGRSIESLALATTATLVKPPIVVQATGDSSATRFAERRVLTVDDDRVRVLAFLSLDDGSFLVRLQSFAEENVRVTLSTEFTLSSATSASFLGDPAEALAVTGRSVMLDIPRLGVAAVVLGATTA